MNSHRSQIPVPSVPFTNSSPKSQIPACRFDPLEESQMSSGYRTEDISKNRRICGGHSEDTRRTIQQTIRQKIRRTIRRSSGKIPANNTADIRWKIRQTFGRHPADIPLTIWQTIVGQFGSRRTVRQSSVGQFGGHLAGIRQTFGKHPVIIWRTLADIRWRSGELLVDPIGKQGFGIRR